MHNNEFEVAYIVSRYNRQREAYASIHPNKEYQVNYGLIIATADGDYLELQKIRAKNKEALDNYNAEVEKRILHLPSFKIRISLKE